MEQEHHPIELNGFPNLTVAAFIFNGDGQVLLIKENYGQHRYGPPGGQVEPGESPAAAVIREVREETTLEVQIERLIGTYYVSDPPWLAFSFLCTVVHGTPVVPDTGEIAEVRWFNPTKIPQPQTRLLPRALPDALSGEFGFVRDYD